MPENTQGQASSVDPLTFRPAGTGAAGFRQAFVEETIEERVELRLELLRALREVPDDVERYVRVFSEASHRRILCSNIVDQLRRESPEWRTVEDLLRQVRPLGGTEDVRGLPDEIASLAAAFDEKRQQTSDDVRLALNKAQGADLNELQDTVYNLVWEMSELADGIADRCSDMSDRLFRDIRRAVQVLFGEIDTQLRHRGSALGQEQAQGGDWDEMAGAGPAPASAQSSTKASRQGPAAGNGRGADTSQAQRRAF
jgi:hypothetical protein